MPAYWNSGRGPAWTFGDASLERFVRRVGRIRHKAAEFRLAARPAFRKPSAFRSSVGPNKFRIIGGCDWTWTNRARQTGNWRQSLPGTGAF